MNDSSSLSAYCVAARLRLRRLPVRPRPARAPCSLAPCSLAPIRLRRLLAPKRLRRLLAPLRRLPACSLARRRARMPRRCFLQLSTTTYLRLRQPFLLPARHKGCDDGDVYIARISFLICIFSPCALFLDTQNSDRISKEFRVEWRLQSRRCTPTCYAFPRKKYKSFLEQQLITLPLLMGAIFQTFQCAYSYAPKNYLRCGYAFHPRWHEQRARVLRPLFEILLKGLPFPRNPRPDLVSVSKWAWALQVTYSWLQVLADNHNFWNRFPSRLET